MENYHKYEQLRNNTEAPENLVVNLIFRKIKHVIAETPEPDDFEETISDLRALIK